MFIGAPKRKPWTEREKTAVMKRMQQFIALRKVPRMDDCLKCVSKESTVLNNRSWKDVKYFVYNKIQNIKKRLRL